MSLSYLLEQMRNFETIYLFEISVKDLVLRTSTYKKNSVLLLTNYSAVSYLYVVNFHPLKATNRL